MAQFTCTQGSADTISPVARSMTYKEAVAVGMDEQLAHLLVHGRIDEDDLVDAVVVVHVVRRELRGPPRLAHVVSRS